MLFAVIIDILILFRIGAARYLKEQGKGWIFYLILIITSPAWIQLAAWIVFGH